ncbi:MAG: response regulator transcription factor [Nitrospirae bacterium]|nr:response regulator transcription factor [Nitrospirota bacterium]
MIKVLITDDHAVVRKGLKQIIDETPGMLAADEAASGNEALEKIRKNEYDVVLLDISMQGKSGLDTLKELKLGRPGLPVLILTIYPEEQYALRVLKAGASGYLTKESAPEELVTAIKKVSEGGRYISPSLAEKLAFNIGVDNTDIDPHERLSDREYQVMCMIASGKTVSEIADEMSLSVKTISTYRTRILEKMGMKNNAEMTHYAIKKELVP